jgi:hypothetical protein
MRQYLSSVLWIAATTIVVGSAQVVTTRSAAERRTVTKLNIELVDNKERIRELEAEMRTRAGMQEVERWNNINFQMAAPQTSQILRSPLQLAAFAARPEVAPRVQMAVARDVAGDAATVVPTILPALPSTPATGSARVVQTSFGASANADIPPAPEADNVVDPHGEPG